MRAAWDNRMIRIGFLIIGIGILIALRMLYIVGIKGDAYTALAQSERVKTIAVREFQRGNIVDRNGAAFTNNEENCLVVFPQLVSDKAWLINCLGEKINGNASDVTTNWKQKLQENAPFTIQRNLSAQQVTAYNALIEQSDLSGIFVLTMRPRYDVNSTACHIIGFVGEADADQRQQLQQRGLSKSTVVGKSGLEYQYNDYLMGAAGSEIGVMSDEKSHQVSTQLRQFENEKQPHMGYDVELTLNRDYQEFLDEAMADKSGGAVLMDIKNGDILAVSSSPGYNQYVGQTAVAGNDYVNKAFSYYPPASVFKNVLILAALEKKLPYSNRFYCGGSITLPGGHRVNCWYEPGHGWENLQTALGNSCNPYFVQLGQQIGGQTIMDYAYNLGLGEQKVIGYNVNSLSDNIAFDVRAEADVANVSIGEKGVRLSPLLVAQLMSTIANGGNVVIPRLVQGVLGEDGRYVKEFAAATPRKVISAASCTKLRGFLTAAVAEGTGRPVNSSIVQIAGKTGTTQNAGVWFAGFAPAENPKYAIAVYNANGESGGSDAGSVAKEVMEKVAVVEGFAQ